MNVVLDQSYDVVSLIGVEDFSEFRITDKDYDDMSLKEAEKLSEPKIKAGGSERSDPDRFWLTDHGSTGKKHAEEFSLKKNEGLKEYLFNQGGRGRSFAHKATKLSYMEGLVNHIKDAAKNGVLMIDPGVVGFKYYQLVFLEVNEDEHDKLHKTIWHDPSVAFKEPFGGQIRSAKCEIKKFEFKPELAITTERGGVVTVSINKSMLTNRCTVCALNRMVEKSEKPVEEMLDYYPDALPLVNAFHKDKVVEGSRDEAGITPPGVTSGSGDGVAIGDEVVGTGVNG